MDRINLAFRSVLNNMSDESMVHDVLIWLESDGHLSTVVADAFATTLPFESALPAREGTNYPGRRNHSGYYWFASAAHHVRHESMLEYVSLMWLDYAYQIRFISAQPMYIRFRDGTTHVPDFFARQSSETRLLIDVHPASLIDDIAAAQFNKTASMCRRIGWTYVLLTEFNNTVVNNLEWLSAYRHYRYAPSRDVADAILQFVSSSPTLGETVAWLKVCHPATGIHVLYNLMWQRVVSFTEEVPLSWSTKIHAGSTT